MTLLEDALKTAQWKELEFEDACRKFLELRRGNISEKTLHEYELNVKTLTKFFKPYRLSEITSEAIHDYQEKRKAEGVGAPGINHETSVLQQLLKRGGLWEEIRMFFHPVRGKKWQPGRVITDQEKARLLRHAQLKPTWAAAYYFAAISVNTSCGPGEVSSLRFKDVFLEKKTFFVPEEGAKNQERMRPIPLNEEAFRAIEMAMERARSLGASQPHHYIFPFRHKVTKVYDPTRRQREFKWSWKKICKSAGLEGLKMYDLRRTFITNGLNDPMVPLETLIKVAGHIGEQTIRHYSYRRIDAMRKVVARQDAGRAPRTAKKRPQPVQNGEGLNADDLKVLKGLAKLLKQNA